MATVKSRLEDLGNYGFRGGSGGPGSTISSVKPGISAESWLPPPRCATCGAGVVCGVFGVLGFWGFLGSGSWSAFGADVVVVLFYYVHRGLLGARGAAVDADVAGHEVLLVVGVGSLVLGHQAARTGIGAVIEQQAVDVLVARVLVVLILVLVVVVLILVGGDVLRPSVVRVQGGVGFL